MSYYFSSSAEDLNGAVGASARSGRGFKWKVPRERARRGRNPFKPQTALLPRRTPVGSEWIWREPDKLKE